MTMVIRPVDTGDLDALGDLVSGAGIGITSLATNRETLNGRIDASIAACDAKVQEPGKERYLFVLEDLESKEVAGMCAVKAAVGLNEPFYSYRLGTVVHASKELDVHRTLPALYLCNDYTGSTELSSLYLSPGYRGTSLGVLLSKSRLLFIAEFPNRFAERVIAEIRGVSDEEGRSPFWDGLGRHFFSMDFPKADYLVGTGNKSFIAELMPKHPIYVLFLPQEAQDVIGEAHPKSRRALEMLGAEGFRYREYVDIFDAGPTVECRRDEIHAVKTSLSFKATFATAAAGDRECLISNTRVQEFRCCVASLKLLDADSVTIDQQTARALLLEDGDTVRVLEL